MWQSQAHSCTLISQPFSSSGKMIEPNDTTAEKGDKWRPKICWNWIQKTYGETGSKCDILWKWKSVLLMLQECIDRIPCKCTKSTSRKLQATHDDSGKTEQIRNIFLPLQRNIQIKCATKLDLPRPPYSLIGTHSLFRVHSSKHKLPKERWNDSRDKQNIPGAMLIMFHVEIKERYD